MADEPRQLTLEQQAQETPPEQATELTPEMMKLVEQHADTHVQKMLEPLKKENANLKRQNSNFRKRENWDEDTTARYLDADANYGHTVDFFVEEHGLPRKTLERGRDIGEVREIAAELKELKPTEADTSVGKAVREAITNQPSGSGASSERVMAPPSGASGIRGRSTEELVNMDIRHMDYKDIGAHKKSLEKAFRESLR